MNLRSLLLLLVTLLLGVAIGVAFTVLNDEGDGNAKTADKGDGPCPGGAQPAYWVAPMDASYRRDEPGKSPMGMDLVPKCQDGALDDNQIAVSPATIQTLGVRTASVERGSLVPTLSLVGRVMADPGREQRVHSRAEGWVQDLGVTGDGDTVAAGDTLYSLFSPQFYAAESDYLAAAGNSGLRRAAAERLRALGYRDAQIKAVERRGKATDTVQIQATAPQTLTAMNVRAGQYVQPGTHLMTLAQLDTLWLLADIEEANIGWLQQGASATVEVSAYPGAPWKAEVERLASGLDPKTRTLAARLVIDNHDGRLRPEMFARAEIAAPTLDGVLSVPASSVIRDGRTDRVIKALGDGRFEVAAVALGQRVDDRWEIRQGLSAGDDVVIQGQFLLDTEANVDAEALRISGTEDATEADSHDQGASKADGEMRHSMDGDMHDGMHDAMEEGKHGDIQADTQKGAAMAGSDHASEASPSGAHAATTEHDHHQHGEGAGAHDEERP